MLQEEVITMEVRIRKFEVGDVPNKVRWINDPKNNVFLHYELPLEIAKTEAWYEQIKDRTDRYDAIIEADNVPVGIIGLLSIDKRNRKAEYYITLGERGYQGKGIATKASKLLLEYGFTELRLNRIYLYTEVENVPAVRLYERLGFRREGEIKNDLFVKGHFIDRYIYGITKAEYYHHTDTPIHMGMLLNGNQLYIKREDFIPFSFGGNKARKAQLFFEDFSQGDYDCIVTYGSSSSNHCRVIANMAASREIPCYIISPEEASNPTYNSALMECFGAEFTICPVTEVYDTIEKKLTSLREQAHRPYFIAGGGHGNIGTQAYVECYEEIRHFEKENNIHFDYIFHASGTGTTQAGLVCGQLIYRDDRQVIGISIARKNPRGRNVVIESVKEYLREQLIDISDDTIDKATIFLDDYVENGYGSYSEKVGTTIKAAMVQQGIPLDFTYTGKAYTGMLDYIKKTPIRGKNILFIHTGGTPLYFDYLEQQKR